MLPSQIVSLESSNDLSEDFDCSFGPGFLKQFKELFPNGNVSSEPFTVPAGKVLIINSVEAVWADVGDTNIGANMTFGIARGIRGLNHIPLIFGVPVGTNNRGSTNVTIPNGLVVRSGTELCLVPAGMGNTTVYLYGFLAPDM